MQLRNLRNAKVNHKRVLVRIDVNIALDGRGRVRDRSRIEAVVPTLRWLLARQAAVILISHRGRPKRRSAKDSLRPMVRPLARAIGRPVQFIAGSIEQAATRQAILKLRSGRVCLLENIRFEPGEVRNTKTFAKQLSQLGEVYINEAFAASHRASASMVGLAKLLPAYAGFRLQAEVKGLGKLIARTPRPYVAILGGAKISTKLGLVRRLLKTADHVILGGALANTMLEAEGLAIGKSLSEPAMLAQAKGLTVNHKHLHIPCDVVVRNSRGRVETRAVGAIRPDEHIVDIGPDSVMMFSRILRLAKTIVWNGPMGVYEQPPFDAGTRAIARAIAKSRAWSVVGGGETVDAVRRQKLESRIGFLSTGGGAMLEFLEGKSLPGFIPLYTRR